ncbi:MAG TPA: DUF4924 domain-containing protein [Flavobacteriales bacterium]|nr:DUF4924 domain-containing protein [Flavobacteriales bacterium]
MLIAEQKKKENIAEYILYMWQIEDLIRGSELSVNKVMTRIFPDQMPSEEIALEYENWFKGIIDEMKRDGLEKQGHLKTVRHHLKSLNNLHRSLLMTFQDKEYQDAYKATAGDLSILKGKSGSEDLTEVEICLTGLYGLMLLRIQKATISEDTLAAMERIGKLVALLARSYKKFQSGLLNLPPEMNN